MQSVAAVASHWCDVYLESILAFDHTPFTRKYLLPRLIIKIYCDLSFQVRSFV